MATRIYVVEDDGTETELSNFVFDEIKFSLEPHEKLNKIAKSLGYYPRSPYSGMCWILEEVLNVNPVTVHLNSFNATNQTYKAFILDKDGNKQKFLNGEPALREVTWTFEERRLLREWWDYIPPELRS